MGLYGSFEVLQLLSRKPGDVRFHTGREMFLRRSKKAPTLNIVQPWSVRKDETPTLRLNKYRSCVYAVCL